jgi:hypothetical protein
MQQEDRGGLVSIVKRNNVTSTVCDDKYVGYGKTLSLAFKVNQVQQSVCLKTPNLPKRHRSQKTKTIAPLSAHRFAPSVLHSQHEAIHR